MAAKEGAERGVLDLARFLVKKGGRDPGFTDDELRAAVQGRRSGGSSAVRDAERGVACALCFPAGTLVVTPGGERPIDTLRAGDMVLAENPQGGAVEAEPVTAVLRDPVKALLAVDLSDGSAITTTVDHPVWVNAGAQLAGPGWLDAGRLRPGDELRTAAGAHVMVVGLRRDVGTAVVYTLTVATDHTFFVGTARVLVHNCGPWIWREVTGNFQLTGAWANEVLIRRDATGGRTGLVNYRRGVWHTPVVPNARAYAIRPYAAPSA